MRPVLLILILATLVILTGFATGWLNLSQSRPATLPSVRAGDGRVSVTPGQTPRFDVEAGSVTLGTRPSNVSVPQVTVAPSTTTVPVPTVTATRPAEAKTAD